MILIYRTLCVLILTVVDRIDYMTRKILLNFKNLVWTFTLLSFINKNI